MFWINKNKLLDRPMSFEVRSIVEHHLSERFSSTGISVGTISVIENKPTINWNSLDSWEGLMGT